MGLAGVAGAKRLRNFRGMMAVEYSYTLRGTYFEAFVSAYCKISN